MLKNLPQLEADPLWGLLNKFHADQRENKIDLLVGVYRDESGKTPVMQVVQDAEQRLVDKAESKAYKQLSGNTKFNAQIAQFLLGDSKKIDTQCTIQTVGGSGALRVLADFITYLSPNAVIWNTDPGYINHRPIMEAAGLKVEKFRWQQKHGELDLDACFTDLSKAKAGDIILLHGCCHNPTGIDPTLKQWQALADYCKRSAVIPFIDMAYQGFGDNPEDDAAGLRLFINQLDLVLVAASCSKNMGLYCERTGAAMVVTDNTQQLENIRTVLERITRANYSMPPEHGAAIASLLFDDKKAWFDELSTCRNRIVNVRQSLGAVFRELNAPLSVQIISQQKGMFSLLPLTAEQMVILREEFAIYGTANGRINVAGLQTSQIRTLAEALISIIKS
ncbi:MAG: aspartate aminotransferase [Psychromonas sp.]|jgi:aspartate aminotransferase|uniref:amino acid aminotransferase n=1 Tax=Psychromonas sp. TaxID=1884585 RepID=UPI0039E59CF4